MPGGVHLRSESVVGRQGLSIDEALDVDQRDQVEARYPLGERVDELDELDVRDGSVDIAVTLGEFAIEVVPADQDLERPPTTDDARQATRGPGTTATPTSSCPRIARSRLAKRMSLARVNSLPAARALPRMAVIVTARGRAEPDEDVRPRVKSRAGLHIPQARLIGGDVIVGQEVVGVSAVEQHDSDLFIILDLSKKIF
jgi:hypothetical protein